MGQADRRSSIYRCLIAKRMEMRKDVHLRLEGELAAVVSLIKLNIF
jgi:hypothetical protein